MSKNQTLIYRILQDSFTITKIPMTMKPAKNDSGQENAHF
jgi:hypothetical protein